MTDNFPLKIGMVSSIRPETNYTAYLVEALQKASEEDLTIYAYCEKDERNLESPLQNLRLCWDRNWRYFYQILLQAKKDRLDVLHFQHEFNMFGGPRTAILFPILIGLSRLLGFKTIVTVHAVVARRLMDQEFLKTFGWPQLWGLTPLIKIFFSFIYFFTGLFSSRIIVHSSGLKETLVKDFWINSKKIVIIPHGVPDEVNYPPAGEVVQSSAVGRPLQKKLENQKFILYFGYFHRRKGLEFLIKAFRELQSIEADVLLVLGGGTIMQHYAQELTHLIERLSLQEKVLVTGFLKLSDLRFLLDHCQFVVLPAIYSIAGSGPLAQVFAHEKAVIVSDLGVYREEIQDGVNGLLVKVGDSHDLFLKMQSLLNDSNLRHRLEEGSRLNHKKRGWSRVSAQTAVLYLKT